MIDKTKKSFSLKTKEHELKERRLHRLIAYDNLTRNYEKWEKVFRKALKDEL